MQFLHSISKCDIFNTPPILLYKICLLCTYTTTLEELKPMIKNNSEDLKSGLDCGFSYTSLVLNVLTTNSRLFWLLFIITSSWWPGHSWTLASVVCHDHCCHILKFMRNYYDCSLQSFGVQKFGSDGQGGIYLTFYCRGLLQTN